MSAEITCEDCGIEIEVQEWQDFECPGCKKKGTWDEWEYQDSEGDWDYSEYPIWENLR